MNLIARTLTICALMHSYVGAQVSGITVTANTHISADAPKSVFFETLLALNPKNPSHMLATASVVSSKLEGAALYSTRDGGKSWHRIPSVSGDTITPSGGDPIVYFDGNGTAFWGSYNKVGLTLARSADGEKWEGPIVVGRGGWDRPWLAFDRSDSPYAGRMYATGGMYIATSTGRDVPTVPVHTSVDGGKTFTQEQRIAFDYPNTAGFQGQPLVTPNGALVIPVMNPVKGEESSILGAVVSDDGGRTFSAFRPGPRIAPDAKGYGYLQALSALTGAIDLSRGPHRGRVYVAWTEHLDGHWLKRVAHTDDLGLHWSDPVTVNDNSEGNTPGNIGIAVNDEGVLALTWNDRRDDPKNRCYRLYFAASIDGGDTFAPNMKVSDTPVCPANPANSIAHPYTFTSDRGERSIGITSVSSRWPNGGDTYGLQAGPKGDFHAAWVNSVEGVMQLWYTRINVNRAELARSLATASSSGKKDLTSVLDFKFDSTLVDIAKGTVTITLHVFNPGKKTYRGPFTVTYARGPRENFPSLRVANAENGKTDRGASWSIGSTTTVLRPGERSEAKVLRWTFNGGIDPTTFVASFRIYGTEE
jgi:hypothetical protein